MRFRHAIVRLDLSAAKDLEDPAGRFGCRLQKMVEGSLCRCKEWADVLRSRVPQSGRGSEFGWIWECFWQSWANFGSALQWRYGGVVAAFGFDFASCITGLK